MGGSAQVTIYRVSDNSQVYGLNANAGETKEEDFAPGAGSYWIKTVKNSPSAELEPGSDANGSASVSGNMSGWRSARSKQ